MPDDEFKEALFCTIIHIYIYIFKKMILNSHIQEVLEEAYASSTTKPVPELSGPRRSKRSKKKRSV